MKSVKYKRETAALVKHFANYCGQGIHGGFRTHCHAEGCQKVYDLIPRYPKWSEVTAACGRVVVQYGLRYPNLKRSNNSRGKLGFLLAKRALQVIRGHKWDEQKDPGVATEIYVFINDQLGFADFRVITEPVADDVLARMLTLKDDCPDCKVAVKARSGKGVACEGCGQKLCPIHCKCAAGGRRAPRARR